jgi:hypothetical protein
MNTLELEIIAFDSTASGKENAWLIAEAKIRQMASAVFFHGARLDGAKARLRKMAETALAAGMPAERIIAAVKAAAQEAGVTASTLSKALVAAGLRQRAERSDKGEKRGDGAAPESAASGGPVDPARIEASCMSMLAALPAEDRRAIVARLATWAAA